MEIEKIKHDIDLYQAEIYSLENVKTCTDVCPIACKYIDKNIDMIKKHIFDLQTKIDTITVD